MGHAENEHDDDDEEEERRRRKRRRRSGEEEWGGGEERRRSSADEKRETSDSGHADEEVELGVVGGLPIDDIFYRVCTGENTRRRGQVSASKADPASSTRGFFAGIPPE